MDEWADVWMNLHTKAGDILAYDSRCAPAVLSVAQLLQEVQAAAATVHPCRRPGGMLLRNTVVCMPHAQGAKVDPGGQHRC